MTTPRERTLSVIRTRRFLQMVATASAIDASDRIRHRAEVLLRHFPDDADLELAAEGRKGWFAVLSRRAGGNPEPSETDA
ncbi:BPSL0761 family protein [Paraburkholderia sediminicola]|uniref:BPSL0761 family protein n=1 Tax=Paraburkholderia sediminicola TaxID=458836 RepID=UPI0038BA2CC4